MNDNNENRTVFDDMNDARDQMSPDEQTQVHTSFQERLERRFTQELNGDKETAQKLADAAQEEAHAHAKEVVETLRQMQQQG